MQIYEIYLGILKPNSFSVFYLPGNSLKDADGNLVTGDIDITFIEIDKKSEMILLNK